MLLVSAIDIQFSHPDYFHPYVWIGEQITFTMHFRPGGYEK